MIDIKKTLVLEEIMCKGYGNCKLSKQKNWGIIELCFCYSHCKKRESYKQCRFYDKNQRLMFDID